MGGDRWPRPRRRDQCWFDRSGILCLFGWASAAFGREAGMSLASADLPSDPDALGAFAWACQSELAAATAELQAAKLAVQLRALEIEKLKFQIAKLRRMQFGRSSERLTRHIEQLELRLEELEAREAEENAQAAAEDRPPPIPDGGRPQRQPP